MVISLTLAACSGGGGGGSAKGGDSPSPGPTLTAPPTAAKGTAEELGAIFGTSDAVNTEATVAGIVTAFEMPVLGGVARKGGARGGCGAVTSGDWTDADEAILDMEDGLTMSFKEGGYSKVEGSVVPHKYNAYWLTFLADESSASVSGWTCL